MEPGSVMENRAHRKKSPKLMGLVFLLAGGLLFYFISLPDLKIAQESKGWPVTTGTINSSELVRVESGNHSDRKITYRPDVQFSYQVDGKAYNASNIGTSSGSSYNYRMAERIQMRYPVGNVVDVYYRVEDPAFAILQPGIRMSDILVAGSLLLFAVLGLLFLFNIIKASPKKSRVH